MECCWCHHGYHAFLGVHPMAAPMAAMCGDLLIALGADVFAAEEVRDVVDIVPGKAMALNVVTAGGMLTVVNVYGPGSGWDSGASRASFRAMYAAAKSAGGPRPAQNQIPMAPTPPTNPHFLRFPSLRCAQRDA